jgi:hypothetical protein
LTSVRRRPGELSASVAHRPLKSATPDVRPGYVKAGPSRFQHRRRARKPKRERRDSSPDFPPRVEHDIEVLADPAVGRPCVAAAGLDLVLLLV